LPLVQAGVGTPGKAPYTVKQALAINRRLVSQSTLAQWLPTMDTGSGAKQYLNCENVAVTPASVPLGTSSVVGFDASSPTTASAIGLSGQVNIAYESTDHLYLTSSGTQMGYCSCVYYGRGLPFWSPSNKTAIFQFDLNGDQASHVATGTVNGSIADRYSMDEVGGILRVATTTTSNKPDSSGNYTQSSSVITLKQVGRNLKQDGRLDGLGNNESLTAARWFDTFAVVSTSANVDPLYTIDLRDPAHPKLLGSLQIPGFSGYFHPIGNGQLLGLGQNVTFNNFGEQSQAQVGLFDISNLAAVKRLSIISMSLWTTLNATSDPHAFTWLADHSVALTSVSTATGSLVLGEFKVNGQTLTRKIVNLTSTDPSMVRTMELPNGKVVLMDGGRVTFLGL
ncbi:MAG TPA: beta-propeller domain-containing protein, partial [Marmoricola sp.]|nr:beta-propeller domain-containing protein [Marmoricola sp.]